ncbi:MAG: hypothetical protein WKF97_14760 [Chitinophagaceae bacterium]
MKNLLFLLMFVSSSIILTQSCSVAKKTAITTENAVSKGYAAMNPGEAIVIYKYQHPAHSPKEADKYGPQYFFSTTASSSEVLKGLTAANLKNAYPANHAFHDALDANFKTEAELINYDDFHKMYKVNRLLQSNSK